MDSDDRYNIEEILEFCEQIQASIERHGDKKNNLAEDLEFQYVCSFLIMQIGEYANRLSVDFVTRHPEIQWRQIVRMRHIITHHYGKINVETLWETVTKDIPPLREFCEQILKQP